MPEVIKNGKITSYGFSCGYVQKIETNVLHKQMFMEHSHFHVQSLKNNTLCSIFIGGASHKYIVWETFEKLSDAIIFYNLIK